MTYRAVQLLSTLSISAGIALLVMSCSPLSHRQIERGQTNRAAQRVPTRHIAQMDFGREASFAVCTEPACPVVTQKSFAAAPDTAALFAPTTVNAATTNTNTSRRVADHTAIDAELGIALIAARHQIMVYFASGSAALTPAGKAALAQSLPYARKANRIVISGRTDSVGADTPNRSLALARVFSVRDYLRERESTLPAVMVLDAKGRCCFIASNDTPRGRQQNRRVEVVFNAPEEVAP